MRYALPADLVTSVTPSQTGGTVDPDYPLTNLHDGDPTNPLRFTTNVQTRLVWDMGSSPDLTMTACVIVMHNLAAGGTVLVQANATNAWGAPSVSVTQTVPAWPDVRPENLTFDLSATTAATTGYRFSSLLLPAQAADQALGEVLWIQAWRSLTHAIEWGLEERDIRRVHVNETSYGVRHTVDRHVRQRRLVGTLRGEETDRGAILALMRAAGADLGWPVAWDPGDPLAVLYVTFHPALAEELAVREHFTDVNDIELDLLEIQRGLSL